MSTFKGRLDENEFRKISIDYFESSNYDCTAFFLSHFHTDHMRGIWDSNFSTLFLTNKVLFYCSEITKSFILNDSRINIPEDKIVALNRSISIEMEEGWVKVTPLPAGHCPGSIMLMFESWKERIIYTGDFRLTLEDLKQMRDLHTSESHPRHVLPLTALYFDSTFANSQYCDFPTRHQSLLIIKEKALSWIQQDPSYKVIIQSTASIGNEFLMVELGKMLSEKIHLPQNHHERFHSVMKPLESFLTIVADNARVHFCFRNSCFPCFKSLYSKKDLLDIRPSALIFTSEHYQKYGWDYFDTENEIYRVAYSSHASFNEIKNFITYLKPSKLHPCVWPRNETYTIELQHLISHMEEKQRDAEDNRSSLVSSSMEL